MSLNRTPLSTPPVSWWSRTTWGMAASLCRRPVCGWVSTITTAVAASMFTVSTGTSGIGISSTIARFSDRAIMPSTVRMTGLPGWAVSTSALIPSMLASESGSGLTCETTTTRANGARTSRSRSDRFRLAMLGLGSGIRALRLGRHRRLDPWRDGAAGSWGRQRPLFSAAILRVYAMPAHGPPVLHRSGWAAGRARRIPPIAARTAPRRGPRPAVPARPATAR